MPVTPPSLWSRAVGRVADVRQRVQTAAAVTVKTGLLWDLHPRGVVTAARLLAAGKSGPSTIYRIHAANTPDKTALVYRNETYTFAELDRRCDAIGVELRRRGLAGHSILVMLKNRPEYLVLATGASRVGSAMVTISWRSTPTELAYLASHCGARAIVFEESLRGVIDRARADLPHLEASCFFQVGGGSDPAPYASFDSLSSRASRDAPEPTPPADAAEEGAVVVYTSGTTGRPKGAVRKFNKDVLPAVFRFMRDTPFRHDDIHLACCPLYHTTAFGFIGMSYILGATVVLLDDFEPTRFLQAIERYRVTTTVLVPTMLHRLLQLDDDEIRDGTRSLRALFTTSAPLPGPDSTRAMELLGDIVYNLYGSTETGMVTLAKPQDLKDSPGTIGRAVAGTEIRLLDDAGNEVADGEIGELYAKNAMLVAGYHHDDEATRGSMRDGFFSVGDLARRDARGCYHLEGRKRDMIISGGVNVYSAEVEQVLEAHPAVDEVAVIGVPDAEWGERVRAVVVLRAESDRTRVDERALQAWCRERLSGPKIPRDLVILPAGEALPRNPTGKVLKRDLRANAP